MCNRGRVLDHSWVMWDCQSWHWSRQDWDNMLKASQVIMFCCQELRLWFTPANSILPKTTLKLKPYERAISQAAPWHQLKEDTSPDKSNLCKVAVITQVDDPLEEDAIRIDTPFSNAGRWFGYDAHWWRSNQASWLMLALVKTNLKSGESFVQEFEPRAFNQSLSTCDARFCHEVMRNARAPHTDLCYAKLQCYLLVPGNECQIYSRSIWWIYLLHTGSFHCQSCRYVDSPSEWTIPMHPHYHEALCWWDWVDVATLLIPK